MGVALCDGRVVRARALAANVNLKLLYTRLTPQEALPWDFAARMARFMTKNIPGISVPQPLIDELEAATDPVECGIRIAARFIEQTRDVVLA